jgi:hypothetical protein
MPASVCEFVDSIGTSPSVRFDLNDDSDNSIRIKDGYDLSPPDLRRAVTSTLLRDGGHVGASAYDNRVIRLPLQCRTTSQSTLATKVGTLLRELNRPTNLLRWQPQGAANPVFFRTFRSSDPSIASKLYNSGRGVVELELLAEPFALGLEQTLASVVISNNPTAGSNPLAADLTGILGDADTPALLELTSTQGHANRYTHIAVTRKTSLYVRQAEALTQGTDTTTQPNDATASGAGNNFSRTTFATATMTTRIEGQFPAASGTSTDYAGAYRVLVRVRRSTAVGDIVVKMVPRFSGDELGGFPEVPTAGHTDWHVLDLGVIEFPFGHPGVPRGYRATIDPLDTGTISFRAERVSGTSTLDWDYVYLQPADDQVAVISWPTLMATTDVAVVDGPNDAVYRITNTNTVPSPGVFPSRSGGLPLLRPGVTNRLHLLRSPYVGGVSGGVNDATTVVARYWPRYLGVSA